MSASLELWRAASPVPLPRIYRPRGVWARNLGLLVRPPLAAGEALWLDPCGSIHTWGLDRALDAVFLDVQHRVLAVRRDVRPWRIALAPRGTRSVLELPAGAAAGFQPGATVHLARLPQPPAGRSKQ